MPRAREDDVLGHLTVRHRTLEVEGTSIFYREAGAEGAPAVLLLHGFPSSSFQYRRLLPALSDTYHVLAPDFPAFGFSSCPERSRYAYTFEHYAETIENFVRALGLTLYALCLHDYGAQVGFRLALRAPELVTALIIQNSEAYLDGRTWIWSATEAYWRDPSKRKREALRNTLFTEKGIRGEFLEQLPPESAELIDPSAILLAWTHLNRPGVVEALLDLHLDYRNNVQDYSLFQDYFRKHQPPTLVIWGRNDQYCTPASAMAYKRDLPNAEIHVIEGGHWALESHGPQVIRLTREFLDRVLAHGIAEKADAA
jgi:pimeloyl-ACP methyl ester carboxylesterase